MELYITSAAPLRIRSSLITLLCRWSRRIRSCAVDKGCINVHNNCCV